LNLLGYIHYQCSRGRERVLCNCNCQGIYDRPVSPSADIHYLWSRGLLFLNPRSWALFILAALHDMQAST
jgi:hypothetical protein